MFLRNKKEEVRKRQMAFDRMVAAYKKLEDLRDAEHGKHNDVINETKALLESVISQTVPLPRDATAKDYYSKMIDYISIFKLCKSILDSEQHGRPINTETLVLDWDDPLDSK
jgi:hypothetical protein